LTYPDAEKYLYQLEGRGWKLDLERIEKLLQKIDSPQQHFASIHIAGTNGKGSVAAMVDSILRQAGYKTGLYTSPHLVEIRERIVVSGKKIPNEEIARLVTLIQPYVDSLGCTFFETITALAFLYFFEHKVEIAVVEVGLGGRFDATNVLTPMLSVITEIDLDHTQHLGDNLQQIAAEKAGIIKPNVPCLLKSTNSAVRDVVNRIGGERGSQIIEVSKESEILSSKTSLSGSIFNIRVKDAVLHNVNVPLIGSHQVGNARTAIVAATLLKSQGLEISNEDIIQGVAMTIWPGRCQIISYNPLVMVDAAHNPASIRALRQTLMEYFPQHRKIIIIGVMADKDYYSMLSEIAPIAQQLITVQPEHKRTLGSKALAGVARQFTPEVFEFDQVSSGLNFAIQNTSPDSLICVTGSHYTIGEVLADSLSVFGS